VKPYYEDSKAGIVIYHGDCRDFLSSVVADVVVTDPPYGVGLTAKQHKWFHREGTGYAPNFEDNEDFVRDVVAPAIRLCVTRFSRVVVTPGTRNCFLYPQPSDIGSAFNRAGTGSARWGFSCSTLVLYYGSDPYLVDGQGGRPNSWEQPPNDYADENGHPCPKPIGLMKWLVGRVSRDGETVIDPFMGSGTTLRAAKDLGRRAIGIEIEERYCEIAARRLSQEVFQFGVTDHAANVGETTRPTPTTGRAETQTEKS
jgi:DNA modification methylase